ncbi:penicillin-binding protein 2 [Fredinandcohnia sp. QZ13]|uniref:peptidoglycan D,D-transpeptidase FtsI family protein n=1 Tax=Fredinandcohnia sp. QZ13 TaxID=3073144 RepID=UPI002853007C|nr:penicillin-binding protein 2 [Fredinandcohnia sp. QZ13]MDR4889565.1 penicillin-binding protein 2 [Fredinandcohnia sp. QZ13]
MKNKNKFQIPIRLNVLFFLVFILFSVLILQLFFVQIISGEEFENELKRPNQETIKLPTPRGIIYDRNFNVLVDNEPVKAITYTPALGTTAKERLELARKLTEFMTVVPETENPRDYFEATLTERELKEYWYLLNKDKADSRLSEQTRSEMDNAEAYNATLNLITEKEISNFTNKDKEIMAIKKELDKATELTPHIINNEGVSEEEYAKIAENLSSLPGVRISVDWNRKYPYGETIRNLLGSITTHQTGIPADKQERYLALGYSLNERVGKSGLEEQYETTLRGSKEHIILNTNKKGEIISSEVAKKGKRGKDLVLTIDIEFQKTVDKIVKEELEKMIKKYPYDNRHMEDALAVVIRPKTGELLAVSGQHYDREKNETVNVAYKVLYDQHIPGSAVKGATVLSGLESGVIKPGEKLYDAPMKIKGTPEKSSYTDNALGWLDDINALKESSNIYMFYIALRMGGEYNYRYNQSVTFKMTAFQEMRNYFNQFGLGVRTGVDFPYEGIGYVGTNPVAGNLMDFAIGQYDTYTTMQLAQYISTIANDGLRVKPHFLKEIHYSTTSKDKIGPIFKNVETEPINHIVMDQEYIKRVQEGFRRVFQEPGGTAFNEFKNKEYNPVGKTGTAENVANGDYTENLTLVGYAPSDNPEIAIAIVVPHTGKGEHINAKIGERIMDAYFELGKAHSL